jgi:hypothetical protein
MYLCKVNKAQNYKKRDMKSVLKLSETEIVTINTIETNDYLDLLLSLGYDLEKVELIKIY